MLGLIHELTRQQGTTGADRAGPTRGARVVLVTLLCAVSMQIGCWARQSINPHVRGRYHGVPVRLAPGSAGFHEVVLTAPSPGWTISLDQALDRFEKRELFVTIRSPNPRYQYAQVVVEQKLATSAPISTSTALFARMIAFDTDAKHVTYEKVQAVGAPSD